MITVLYLTPRFRISGDRAVVHLYVCMTWTGEYLPGLKNFNACESCCDMRSVRAKFRSDLSVG